MKALKIAALALLMAAVPMVGSAQDKKKTLNPWIDCGIGAMIFDETGWAAVSSNVIWDLGTTAVTSDQASQNTCNSRKAQMATYIGATYANLSEEAVKGEGKHLHAMLDIMSCEPAARRDIIGSIRKDFAQYLGDAGYVAKPANAKAEDFYNIVNSVAARQGQQCRV